ncbi:mechanosensitive ion channel family protein [Patescibacteria group bacterium]|nr:mechanosensitive ion channel family protein [Patescibacteria group bacterium]
MNVNVEMLAHTVLEWLIDHGIFIIATLLGTWIVSKFIKRLIARFIRRAIPRSSFATDAAEKKREDTLIGIVGGFLSIFIWVVAILVVLDSVGVPIGALITGAGIIGVAIGFGAQSLVKDVINGLFIIAENQFRIGDVVTVSGCTGTVEAVTLRVTKLRELDGTVHYIPNGEIKVTSNESKDFSMVDVTIDIGYDDDIDTVRDIINRLGKEIAEDTEFKNDIIDPPYFLRVQDLSHSSVKIRILSKVVPNQQYRIAGELRKRIKERFAKEGITIPYPTRVTYNIQK